MSRLLVLLVIFTMLVLFSPFAEAANGKIQWQLYMVAITVISVVGAMVVANRKKDYEAKMIKFFAISVYFWVFTFAQLGILALIYSLI
jgi:hypothetical protein